MHDIKRNFLSANRLAPRQYIIQLNEQSIASKEAIQLIENKLSVKLEHYIPHNSYIIFADPSLIAENENELSSVVSWIGPVEAEYKHAFNVTKQLNFEKDAPCESNVQLHVSLLAPLPPSFFKLFKAHAEGRHIVISTCFQQMKQVIAEVSKFEQVHWIEHKMPIQLLNFAAAQIIQNGATAPASSFEQLHMFKHGIRGQGEVVACGDTGVDHDMCFFSDVNYGPFTQFNKVVKTHRKLQGYYQVTVSDPSTGKVLGKTDTQDEVNGHGTHVAGSLTGSLQFPMNSSTGKLYEYQGMAPDAKLCFIDLHSPTVGLTVPADLYTQYFAKSYECGARIHSNSWGCSVAALFNCVYDCSCTWALDIAALRVKKGEAVSDDFCQETFGVKRCCEFCNQYNNYASDTDRFLYEHEDMVILFAAGNSGFVSKTGSITAPATSKNIISVGASHSSFENFVKSVDYTDYAAILPLVGLKSIEECCASAAYQLLCCPDKIREAMHSDPHFFGPQQLAYFSSRGPTSDQRIKPEIVAPGYNVISAHSDGIIGSNQCAYPRLPKLGNDAALFSNRGTSMATPIASGATALVRQYIQTVLNVTNPSGALVKAMVVHTAQDMTGIVRLNGRAATTMQLSTQRYPNNFNGYGLVQLQSVFFNESVLVTVAAHRKQIESKQSNHYVFVAASGSSSLEAEEPLLHFRATLAWYDPPSSPIATGNALINDLHLDVYIARSYDSVDTIAWTRYTGNSGSRTPSENDAYTDYDVTNPLEQVSLVNHTLTKKSIVLVVVRAPLVAMGKSQAYSLVITRSPQLVEAPEAITKQIQVPRQYEPSTWALFVKWFNSIPANFWFFLFAIVIGGLVFTVCASIIVVRKFRIYMQRRRDFAPVQQGTFVELPEDPSLHDEEASSAQQGNNNRSAAATYYR